MMSNADNDERGFSDGKIEPEIHDPNDPDHNYEIDQCQTLEKISSGVYHPTVSEMPGIIEYLENLVGSLWAQYQCNQDPSSAANTGTIQITTFIENAIEDLKSHTKILCEKIDSQVRGRYLEKTIDQDQRASCHRIVVADVHASEKQAWSSEMHVGDQLSSSVAVKMSFDNGPSSSRSTENLQKSPKMHVGDQLPSPVAVKMSFDNGSSSSRPTKNLQMVEIKENSGVSVSASFLDRITRTLKANPGEMARQLFKRIIGKEKLSNMTVNLTKGREQIPEPIYEAIQDYVSKNCRRSRRLKDAEFHQKITKMCCALRVPTKR